MAWLVGGVAWTGSGALWIGSETAGGDMLLVGGVGAGVVGVAASGLGTVVGPTAGVGAETVRGTGLAGLLVTLLDPTAFLDCRKQKGHLSFCVLRLFTCQMTPGLNSLTNVTEPGRVREKRELGRVEGKERGGKPRALEKLTRPGHMRTRSSLPILMRSWYSKATRALRCQEPDACERALHQGVI